jgi:hypothetical protein
MDAGFFITFRAVGRQLAAMPSDFYELRLIHSRTRKPLPIQPFWSAVQLARGALIRLLRLRNREGFEVYLRPFAGQQNAGYILVDLDTAAADTLDRMRAHGHQPCVVLQTSPGHLQAWIRVSHTPLEPGVATAIGRHLANVYGGDLASSDWRHLGRLAGFTNQKPARRFPQGHLPWVRLLHAQAQIATQGPSLVQIVDRQRSAAFPQPSSAPGQPITCPAPSTPPPSHPSLTLLSPEAATAIYQRFLNRLRIPQRFPQPDWSIADFWIAKALLRCRTPAAQVEAILRLGSPGFPRRHARPEDYLARTLQRAALEVQRARFLARLPRGCVETSDPDHSLLHTPHPPAIGSPG